MARRLKYPRLACRLVCTRFEPLAPDDPLREYGLLGHARFLDMQDALLQGYDYCRIYDRGDCLEIWSPLRGDGAWINGFEPYLETWRPSAQRAFTRFWRKNEGWISKWVPRPEAWSSNGI